MDWIARGLVGRAYIAAGAAVVLVAAGLTIFVGSIASILALLGVQLLLTRFGLGDIPGIAFGVVMVLGALVPAFAVTIWTYRHLPPHLRNGPPAEGRDEDVTAGRVQAGRPTEPGPTLGELDARHAPRAGRAGLFESSRQSRPAGSVSTESRSSLAGLVRGAARAAGIGLGIGFAYVDAALVGDGPLWLAEIPLIIGAVAAVVVAARVRSKPIASAAEGFIVPCVLFALLFLGAG